MDGLTMGREHRSELLSLAPKLPPRKETILKEGREFAARLRVKGRKGSEHKRGLKAGKERGNSKIATTETRID